MSGHWQSQPQPFGHPPPGYGAVPPPPRRGMPTWVLVLLTLFVIGAVIVVALCAGVSWLISQSPGTAVLPGSAVSAKHVDEIKQLGLLEANESIKFFYSDGMFDIKDGMYFFTDNAVVIYSTLRNPQAPHVRLVYADIIDITHEDSDDFWIDSVIWIETEEEFYYFPVSNEAGGDEKFFDLLYETWIANGGVPVTIE